jgi:hypothetical protein
MLSSAFILSSDTIMGFLSLVNHMVDFIDCALNTERACVFG